MVAVAVVDGHLALGAQAFALVLLGHLAQLLFGLLVAPLELGHLARLLLRKYGCLVLPLSLAAPFRLRVNLVQLGATRALVAVPLSTCSALRSSCLALGIVLGAAIAICARGHVVGLLTLATDAAALMTQALGLVLVNVAAHSRSLAPSALILGLVCPATVAQVLVRRLRSALLAAEREHALQAADGSSSAGDASQRGQRVLCHRRCSFASGVFAFAAGPALSLNWGGLHIHGIHNDRVVGARRRRDGLLGLLHRTAL